MAFRLVFLGVVGLVSLACDKSSEATRNSLAVRCNEDKVYAKANPDGCKDTNPGTAANPVKVQAKK